MTDLEARIRERLADLIWYHMMEAPEPGSVPAALAIMREFALRPVAQGVVDSESGEVK